MFSKKIYKDKNPYETINEIRKILYNVGIFVLEKSDNHGHFYHSHLTIANDNLFNVGLTVNGKGITPEYALASAYGELIERIQNHFLFGAKYATKRFFQNIKSNNSFKQNILNQNSELLFEAAEDERLFTLSEYINNHSGLTFNTINNVNTHYIKESEDKSLLNDYYINCYPYFDVISNRTYYLPVDNPHTGSNGMCAGNTPEEAILQGICEILERNAVKDVFIRGIIPPQVPLEVFKGTEIYNRINSLQGNDIIIFDCSMRHGVPVLGVLIIDKIDQKYRMMFGCATSPEIALERCLTEHFQGIDYKPNMNFIYKKKKYPNRTKNEIKQINFYHQLINGSGEIEITNLLFNEPSFPFEGFQIIEGIDHKTELNSIFLLLKETVNNIFIRNNSNLGFPAYHIYIPEISDTFNIMYQDDIYLKLKSEQLSQVMLNLKNSDKTEILSYCLIKDRLFDKVRPYIYNPLSDLLYNDNADYQDTHSYFMLSLLFLYCEEINYCIKYLEKFTEFELEKDSNADLTYYQCVKHILIEKKKNKDIENIKQEISNIYPVELVDEIISDIILSDDKLKYFNFPNCFNCDFCTIKSSCKYFEVTEMCRRIQDYGMKNKINQSETYNIFRSTEKVENP